MELKLKLSGLALLLVMISAVGCGSEEPTAGKNISGDEYNKIASQGMSEADKQAQQRMSSEASVPGANQGGR